MTGMMIGEPDRVGSKPHPENFRQTLTSAPLLVELKHRRLAKRSFQSRRVRARSLELREYPRPIAIGWLMYPRQRYDIHIGWLQSGVVQHELDALVRKARMIFFSRRSLFLQRHESDTVAHQGRRCIVCIGDAQHVQRLPRVSDECGRE
jgi:hypothetical protein